MDELPADRRARLSKQTLSTIYVWITLLCCLHQNTLVVANPITNRFNCTEKPIIEFAYLLSTDDSYIKYECNQGMRMLNPLTMEPSDGILECSTISGWTPQPFPVCRSVETAASSGAKLKTADNEEPSNVICKCPHENFKDLRVSKVILGSRIYKGQQHLQSSNDGYNIGDTLIFTCNVFDVEISLFNTKSENFFVYPSPYRTCQPDCTWSGPQPVCLDPLKPALYNKVPLSNARNCQTDDCFLEKTKDWIPAGDRKEKKKSNNYTRVFWIEFPRHVHLSFMTFKSTYGNGCILDKTDVQIEVNPLAVVSNFSSESHYLANSQYEKLQLLNQRSVIKLRAFTREVIVKLYAETPSDWSPQIEFYTVPEAGVKGLNSGKCPSPPKIPNARMEVSKDGMNVHYYCNKGYQLKDPRNLFKKLPSGKVRCNNGFEWTPYPLPVCYSGNPFSGSTYDVMDAAMKTLLNHSDSYEGPHFLNYLQRDNEHRYDIMAYPKSDVFRNE